MTPKRRALLLVDIQNDFLPPSGSLAVPQGDRILDPVRKLLTDARWDLVVASQDHHPPGHVSFASSHTGKKPLSTIELASGKMQVLWPDHCVQGTGGASIEASVVERLDRLQAVIVRKGEAVDRDAYSAFETSSTSLAGKETLADVLSAEGIEDLYVCGLATDYCVRQSVLGGLAHKQWRVHVITDCVAAIGDNASCLKELAEAGARTVHSSEVL